MNYVNNIFNLEAIGAHNICYVVCFSLIHLIDFENLYFYSLPAFIDFIKIIRIMVYIIIRIFNLLRIDCADFLVQRIILLIINGKVKISEFRS
jgi:hypothetical protein